MKNMKKVWLVSENPKDYSALYALTHAVYGEDEVEAVALWIGDREGAEEVKKSGAGIVYSIEKNASDLYENYSMAAINMTMENTPDAVLCATTKRTRLFSARLAAAHKTRVIHDVVGIVLEDGSLVAEHVVYGGNALCKEEVKEGPAVVLVSNSLLVSFSGHEFTSEAQIREIDAVSSSSDDLHLVSKKECKVEAVSLSSVQNVVSVGRGFEKEEDLGLARDLATVLQGDIGCTRPIAEGSGWLSKERYVGVSGVMLKPNLFVAIGLSGQIQHMVGANSAKTIIAINNDKNAPIFKQADYGIIGDLHEVLPQLIELIS